MRRGICAFVAVIAALVAIPAHQATAAKSRCLLASPFVQLRGSSHSMALQNRIADEAGLPRFSDRASISQAIEQKKLVEIPRSEIGFFLSNPSLPYAAPHAYDFLAQLSRDFNQAHKSSLKITSLVRTERYQRILEWLGVSDANGEDSARRSVHTTGYAFDISKRTLTAKELVWLRRRFVALENQKKIEATEEMCANAFHIMVFPPRIKAIKKRP